MDIGGRQALINRANKGRRGSSTKGSNNGRPTRFRASCPVCMDEARNWEGQQAAYVYISGTARSAVCKKGHRFEVGAGSR